MISDVSYGVYVLLGLVVAGQGCNSKRCGSDADCKGERICQEGACIDPPHKRPTKEQAAKEGLDSVHKGKEPTDGVKRAWTGKASARARGPGSQGVQRTPPESASPSRDDEISYTIAEICGSAKRKERCRKSLRKRLNKSSIARTNVLHTASLLTASRQFFKRTADCRLPQTWRKKARLPKTAEDLVWSILEDGVLRCEESKGAVAGLKCRDDAISFLRCIGSDSLTCGSLENLGKPTGPCSKEIRQHKKRCNCPRKRK